MSEKKKGEGITPSHGCGATLAGSGAVLGDASCIQRDGKRDETDSLTTFSIARDAAKVKRVCENLLEYAKACRYALSRGERYASLPMREEDAADFEWAAEMLEAIASGEAGAQGEKTSKPKRGEPVGEFRSYAAKTGCALLYEALGAFEEMRNRKKKPLTDYARRRAISKLRSLASDPNVQAQIVLQSVDHCWEGFFALKGDGRQALPSVASEQSSFETDEFYAAALRRTQEKFAQ